ncbi:unnamed protein product, partial [Oppiella nova]
NGRYFKLADFGLASLYKVSDRDHQAPEVQESGDHSRKSDVYSLAITTEEIFDFDLENIMESDIQSSSQKYSSDNEVLNKCVVHLKQEVKTMLSLDPTVRPSCGENCLTADPTFGDTLRLIKRNANTLDANKLNDKHKIRNEG